MCWRSERHNRARVERKAAQPQKQSLQKGQPHAGQGSGFFWRKVVVEQSLETRRCVLPVVLNP